MSQFTEESIKISFLNIELFEKFLLKKIIPSHFRLATVIVIVITVFKIKVKVIVIVIAIKKKLIVIVKVNPIFFITITDLTSDI